MCIFQLCDWTIFCVEMAALKKRVLLDHTLTTAAEACKTFQFLHSARSLSYIRQQRTACLAKILPIITQQVSG